MKRKSISLFILLFLVAGLTSVRAQDIALPAPDRKGGKPLMQAMNERQSIRTFTQENLTTQQLSDILWAAWGINRPDKKRTAPSARNFQEMDVYAAMAGGLYKYDAEAHALKQVHNRDIRSLTGTQPFVGTVPVNLIYVADLARLGKKEGAEIKDAELFWSYANTGFMAQNVYLYCASANLGCVIRGLVPKDKLAPEMGLRPNQVIILAQTVGIIQK